MQTRYIIFAVGGIGDVLMATPMLRAIKKNNLPDPFIAVYTNNQGAYNFLLEFGKDIDLLINGALLEKRNKFSSFQIIRLLKSYRFNVALHTSTVVARKYYLIPFLAKIKNRFGFKKEGLKVFERFSYKLVVYLLSNSLQFIINKDHRVSKNLKLLEFIKIQNNEKKYYIRSEFEKKKIKKTIVGIHPGSDKNGIIKRWEIEKFSLLVKKLSLNDNYQLIVFFGPDETDLLQFFNDDKNIKLIYNKTIVEVVKIIDSCDYFISNDSGLSHIASALNIPQVLIFGPTISNEYSLPTNHIVVEKNLPCRPCFQSKDPCVIGHRCMSEIHVEDVILALNKLKTTS